MLSEYQVNVEIINDNNYLELPFSKINKTSVRSSVSFVWFVNMESDKLKSYLMDRKSFEENFSNVYFSINATVKKFDDKYCIYIPDVFMEVLSVDYQIKSLVTDNIEYYQIGKDNSTKFYIENYVKDAVPLYYNNILMYRKNSINLKASLVHLLRMDEEKYLILSVYKNDSEFFIIYTKVNQYVEFEDSILIKRQLVNLYSYDNVTTIGVPIPRKLFDRYIQDKNEEVVFSAYLNNNFFFFRIGGVSL